MILLIVVFLLALAMILVAFVSNRRRGEPR